MSAVWLSGAEQAGAPAMNIHLNANSPGERIVLAVVLLGLLVDLMDIEWTTAPSPEPMTIERAEVVCGGLHGVKRMNGWEVECREE